MVQSSGRCFESVGIPAIIRCQNHIRQDKLLAFGADSEHIGVNAVRTDILGVEVAVRVIDHSPQLLGGAPAPLHTGEVTETVGLNDTVVLQDGKHGLGCNGDGKGVTECQRVVVPHQQVPAHLGNPDQLLDTKPGVFHRHVVTHLEDGCVAVAGGIVQKVTAIQFQLVLNPRLLTVIEIL